jgi:hypothetical protein
MRELWIYLYFTAGLFSTLILLVLVIDLKVIRTIFQGRMYIYILMRMRLNIRARFSIGADVLITNGTVFQNQVVFYHKKSLCLVIDGLFALADVLLGAAI